MKAEAAKAQGEKTMMWTSQISAIHNNKIKQCTITNHLQYIRDWRKEIIWLANFATQQQWLPSDRITLNLKYRSFYQGHA